MNALDYLFIFLAAAAGAWFGAYLRRKGQNLADKEDIEKLTQCRRRPHSIRQRFGKPFPRKPQVH